MFFKTDPVVSSVSNYSFSFAILASISLELFLKHDQSCVKLYDESNGMHENAIIYIYTAISAKKC